MLPARTIACFDVIRLSHSKSSAPLAAHFDGHDFADYRLSAKSNTIDFFPLQSLDHDYQTPSLSQHWAVKHPRKSVIPIAIGTVAIKRRKGAFQTAPFPSQLTDEIYLGPSGRPKDSTMK